MEVHDSFVARGRFLSRLDVNRGAKVAVLGADIVDALFPYLDPIDKEITIDGRRFRVIGVLERKGKFLWESMDNMLLIPVNSLEKKNQRFNFMVADLLPISPAHIDQAVDQTAGRHAAVPQAEVPGEGQLRHLRPGHPDRDLPPDHRGHLHGDDRDLLDRAPGGRRRAS